MMKNRVALEHVKRIYHFRTSVFFKTEEKIGNCLKQCVQVERIQRQDKAECHLALVTI